MRLPLVCISLLVACGRNDAAPPPPAKAAGEPEVKRMKPDEIAAPHHTQAAMAESEDQFAAVETNGTMEASLNGEVIKFEFLPTGSNVAIAKPAKDDPTKRIARVSIGGAPTTRGLPRLELSLEGVELDKLTLPATFTVTADDAAPVRARIEYEITEQKVWRSEPGATVTIESYVGKRVKGTFAGKLVARSAAFGPPIDVANGRFDVELRLNGAAPGPS